jgi:hypothetical protein
MSRASLIVSLLATVAACGGDSATPDATPVDAPAGGPCPTATPTVTISVDLAHPGAPLRSLQGFLNGIDPAPGSTATFDDAAVRALAPAYWRFGTGAATVFPKIAGFGATLTYILSDGYADSRGGYSNARPWQDWAGFEAHVAQVARANLDGGRPIRYFDIWNEPQGGTPWLGTYDQLLEYYDRTVRAVRAVDPQARFVGPSFDDLGGNVGGHSLGDLLVDLDARFGIRLDAISWHELGAYPPSELPTHAALARQVLAQRLPGATPELHVNEYSSPRDHLLPGWTVGWLVGLTAAGIDVATRACWDVPGEGWSDCWAGLDGLLRRDNRTPQANYWAHRLYAALPGLPALPVTTTDPRAAALAVAPSPTTARVLAGRFVATPPGPAATLGIELIGLPPTAIRVAATGTLVPPQAGAMPAPLDLGVCRVDVVGGRAMVVTPAVPDGAALGLELTLE